MTSRLVRANPSPCVAAEGTGHLVSRAILRQLNLEVYIHGCAVEDVLAWIDARVGLIGGAEEAGDARVYHARCDVVVVTRSVENGWFSVWFKGTTMPWETHVDCARDAAHELGCTVRCEPDHPLGPSAPWWSDVFLELHDGVEQLVTWRA